MPPFPFLASQIDLPGVWSLRSQPFWAWILIGLIAGWLAGLAFRGKSFGCITDIVLGLVGSVIGGWLFNYAGIMGGDFYYSLAAATAGAIVLVGISRLFAGGRTK